jgi:hypothetical protein
MTEDKKACKTAKEFIIWSESFLLNSINPNSKYDKADEQPLRTDIKGTYCLNYLECISKYCTDCLEVRCKYCDQLKEKTWQYIPSIPVYWPPKIKPFPKPCVFCEALIELDLELKSEEYHKDRLTPGNYCNVCCHNKYEWRNRNQGLSSKADLRIEGFELTRDNINLYRLIQATKNTRFIVPEACFNDRPPRKVLENRTHQAWRNQNKKNRAKYRAKSREFANDKGWKDLVEKDEANDEPESSDSWIQKAYTKHDLYSKTGDIDEPTCYDPVYSYYRVKRDRKDIVARDVEQELKKRINRIKKRIEKELHRSPETKAKDRTVGYICSAVMGISIKELKNSTVKQKEFIKIWESMFHKKLSKQSLNSKIKRIMLKIKSLDIDRKMSSSYSEREIKSLLSSVEGLGLAA